MSATSVDVYRNKNHRVQVKHHSLPALSNRTEEKEDKHAYHRGRNKDIFTISSKIISSMIQRYWLEVESLKNGPSFP